MGGLGPRPKVRFHTKSALGEPRRPDQLKVLRDLRRTCSPSGRVGMPLEEKADVEFVGHADAAMHLQALGRRRARRLACLGLGDRDVERDGIGAASIDCSA